MRPLQQQEQEQEQEESFLQLRLPSCRSRLPHCPIIEDKDKIGGRGREELMEVCEQLLQRQPEEEEVFGAHRQGEDRSPCRSAAAWVELTISRSDLNPLSPKSTVNLR